MSLKPSLTLEDEHFISPREAEEQVLELGHDLFELLMLQVDQGGLTTDQAFVHMHEAAKNPSYADQLLGQIALNAN